MTSIESEYHWYSNNSNRIQIHNCKKCNLIFKNKNEADRHNLQKHITNNRSGFKKIWRCLTCNKYFDTNERFEAHYIQEHRGELRSHEDGYTPVSEADWYDDETAEKLCREAKIKDKIKNLRAELKTKKQTKKTCPRCGEEINKRNEDCKKCIHSSCQVNWNGVKAKTLCTPCQRNICAGHGTGVTPEQRSKRRPYRLNLYERSMEIHRDGRGHFFRPHLMECRRVDNLGLFVYHDGKQELTDDLIRHYIPIKRQTTCIVIASSVKEAIETFYRDWEGANVGGDTPSSKALWINRDENRLNPKEPSNYPIEELPPCAQIHMNSEDRPTCGLPIQDIPDHPDRNDSPENKDGEFGMCVLDDADYCDQADCPMEQYDRYDDKLPHHKIEVNGLEFEYVTSDDIHLAKKTIEDEEARKKEAEVRRKEEEKLMKSSFYRRMQKVTL